MVRNYELYPVIRLIAVIVFVGLVCQCGTTALGKERGERNPAWSKKEPWMVWGKEYFDGTPTRGGYHRTASGIYVGYLNPNHWPVNDWVAISMFYEGITATDGQFKQKNPWLLDSWTFSDPLTLIMKLKKGITFHDGSTFDAPGLKYQVDWMRDPKNGCWTRAGLARIVSVEVIDEYTLKWRTKTPWASFPTGFFGFVISAEALKNDVVVREADNLAKKLKTAEKRLKRQRNKTEKAVARGGKSAQKAEKKLKRIEKAFRKLRTKATRTAELARGLVKTDQFPVGTGPYMYEKARPGNYLKVKRNPNWWFGQSVGHPNMPYFDGVKITVIPNPATRLANLRVGRIDTLLLSKAQYRALKNDPSLIVNVSSNNSVRGLNFNHSRKPCSDLRVRKAISHAIDRKALIHGTQFGLGRIASCLFPGDHWAHNPNLKPVSYDPGLSRRLLSEAGYEDGLTLRGWVGNDPDSVKFGQAIKALLARVGIRWKIDSLSAVGASDRWRNLDYDMIPGGFPFIQDPDTAVSFQYHPKGSANFGRSNNEAAISLIERARSEVDETKRAALYFEVEKVLYENYEDIWLWWEVIAVAHRKRLQGINPEMARKYGNLHSYSHPLWFRDGRRESP